MKKLFSYLTLVIAIASFGGITAMANAQSAPSTIPPQEAAQLQQTIQMMSQELATLQAEAQAQSAGTAAAPAAPTQTAAPATNGPTITLSASDKASMNSALTALIQALTGLENTIAANPQVATTNERGISAALQGIGATLVSMTATLNGTSMASAPTIAANNSGSNGATAMANPAAPSAANENSNGGTAVSVNTAPSAASANQAPAAVAPETAQASSAFSFGSLRWPYIVAGILAILAIALWLFWPGEDQESQKKGQKKSGNAPVKPAPAPQSPQMTILASSGKPVVPPQASVSSDHVSASVSASMQKPDMANANRMTPPPRVVTPQPNQQQQRRPA